MSSAPHDSVRLDAQADAGLPPLGVFAFGETGGRATLAGLVVPLAPLSPATPEAWIGTAPPEAREHQGIRYASDGTWLMGELRVDAPESEHIEEAAFSAYQRLLAFNAASGYPHLLRVWNYLDRLNEGAGDAERYRRFCVGRHRAIALPGFEERLPAATVIGSREAGLFISFLAGRVPGVQVENPRQTSAFRYPRDYGPISPSFSRATLLGRNLLVSGTAAVVGHVTRHPQDALAQLDEILANVEALLAHAQRQHFREEPGTWAPQALRLYVRQDADLPRVRPRVHAAFGPQSRITLLRGDISRSDLMLEIEGVWTFRPPG